CKVRTQVRKITQPVVRRRDHNPSAVQALRHPRALIVHEEESLALHDWPAEGAAVLILLKHGPLRREEVARIQGCIANELECVPVEAVGAGFCNHADLASAVIPKL